MTKAFWKSKTFWFNALTIITVLATAVGYKPNADLAEAAGALLIAMSPFVNFALRLYTEKKIGIKDKE